MKKALGYLGIAFALLGLSACQPVMDNAGEAAEGIKANAVDTAYRVRDYFTYIPPRKTQPQPTPLEPRYCYRVLQDIICYRAPLPDEEARLVGWQGGEHAHIAQSLRHSAAEAPLGVTSVGTLEPLPKPLFVSEAPAVKEPPAVILKEPPSASKGLY